MAMPSAQDIQEQIRQQQLIRIGQQQILQSMAAEGNYPPFIPQLLYQNPNIQHNERAKEVPVRMGKFSLLAISFSLMLLGAFTFLGGFLLGIYVAEPRVSQPAGTYLPSQPYYPQQQPSPPSISPVENDSSQSVGTPAQLPVITPQNKTGTVPTAPAFVPVTQEAEGGYTIQLGVYGFGENANALMNHLQALGYSSQVTEGKSPDGSTIYYVRSGFYKDYPTALSAASQFSAHNIPGAIIVKVNQQHKNAL